MNIKEETLELIEKAQNGCLLSRNKIVELNAPLVHKEAWRRARGFPSHPLLDKEDLFQEGIIGLMRAIDTYDSSKASFSTYAVPWIKQKIGRYIQNNYSKIRIPVHAQQLKNKKNLTKIQKKTVALTVQSFTSIDATCEDGSSFEIEQAFDYNNIDKIFAEDAFQILNYREKKILGERFSGRTLDSVAKDFNVSRERIRQIVKASIKKIRGVLKTKKFMGIR